MAYGFLTQLKLMTRHVAFSLCHHFPSAVLPHQERCPLSKALPRHPLFVVQAQGKVLPEVSYRWCLIPAEHAVGNEVHVVFEGHVLMFPKPVHRGGWHSRCNLQVLVGEKQINQGTVPPVTNRGRHS